MALLSRNTMQVIIAGATEGERNPALFRAAADMSGNGFPRDIAEGYLIPAAERSGLQPGEIRQAIGSAFSKPRSPSRQAQDESDEIVGGFGPLPFDVKGEDAAAA